MKRRTFIKIASAVSALGLAGAYPVFIERNLIQYNRYRIRIPNLPKEFDGFRVVQITDIHYGFLVSLLYVNKIMRRVKGIPRDVIVCTGDYVHEFNSTKQIDTIWPLLCELNAPYGVFSILGNHDHWASTARSLYWQNKSGQNLRHTVKHIERNGKRLWFAGAGDLWEDHFPVDEIIKDIPENETTIVLAHNPDTADTCNNTKIDLWLCGHTHGGQVNVPFIGTPVLPVKNRNYSSGLKKSRNNHTVFISRGIGWALYPVRFNCFPEVAIIELIS